MSEQTSRTNITEAPDVAAQVAYEMSVFLHGAEMAPPVAPGWLAKIREWQARLAAEPRSDAVTAPDLVDHEAARREALDTAWPQLREERRSDVVTAQPNPSDSASPDEPSTWKELIAAGRASGIETALDEPSTLAALQRMADPLDAVVVTRRAWREARAASASVPPLTGSHAEMEGSQGHDLWLTASASLPPLDVPCVHPGCGLPERLHGAPDRSRVTHSNHWYCSRAGHPHHRHGPRAAYTAETPEQGRGDE